MTEANSTATAAAIATAMDVDGDSPLHSQVPPIFSDALEFIHDKSGIPFTKCVISADSLIDEAETFVPSEGELFSLDFLDAIRLQSAPAPQPAPAKSKRQKESEYLERLLAQQDLRSAGNADHVPKFCRRV